jgi:signal transduction histidine kinase
MATRFQDLKFQTKVLLAVVGVMILLVAATMFMVNRRLNQQLQSDTEQALRTAESVFKNSQNIRGRNLLLRYRNLAQEPRYRAACQQQDPKTLKNLLSPLVDRDLGGDIVQYKNNTGDVIAAVRKSPQVDLLEFARNSEPSVALARELADPPPLVVRVGNALFDVISVPVMMPLDREIIGTLTFAVQLDDLEAREFQQITGSDIVLLADRIVAASSLKNADLFNRCVELFSKAPVAHSNPAPALSSISDLNLGEQHYLALAGSFNPQSADSKLGYVLLYSKDRSLSELQATQRIIVGVALAGMILSTMLVWILIGNITKPLRELRDTAEAVGKGDFTRKVNVTSSDECGELGNVFNRMTERLQVSREKLEETVDTLRNTQEQLIQREKLSAIGEFIAGVTHELNNPLTSLLGFAELLQETKTDPQQRRFVDRIVTSAKRCQKIVQSLLSFARQHQPERKLTDVNELLGAVLEIMAYEMRTSNIEVTTELAPDLPKLMVDGHQIQQVFLNIVNNGRQAMESQSGGTMLIRSERAHDSVRISFSDNGPGISEENLKKIFDPFFTTKVAGKGTGLGLSLSYGIIREHGGTIIARSLPGQGAAFIIELPVNNPSVESTEKEIATPAPVLPQDGIGKSVLVIDDEEAILDFVREVLAKAGYAVDTASNGDAALRQLHIKDYDLTICDWKMPGLNGRDLYQRIKGEDPNAAQRFVFMTGDVINEKIQTFLNEEKKTCLTKPFSIVEFRTAISGCSRN